MRALREHADSATRLAHQATHDALTGLPNRVYLHQYLTDELSRRAPAPVGAPGPVEPAVRRPAVPRPRPVQARERHDGPRHRRRAAHRGGRSGSATNMRPTTWSAGSAATSSSSSCSGAPDRAPTRIEIAERARLAFIDAVHGARARHPDLGERRRRDVRAARGRRRRGRCCATPTPRCTRPRTLGRRRGGRRSTPRCASGWPDACCLEHELHQALERDELAPALPADRAARPRPGRPGSRRCCAGRTRRSGQIGPGRRSCPIAEDTGLIVEHRRLGDRRGLPRTLAQLRARARRRRRAHDVGQPVGPPAARRPA